MENTRSNITKNNKTDLYIMLVMEVGEIFTSHQMKAEAVQPLNGETKLDSSLEIV